jgi:hypothetical protein
MNARTIAAFSLIFLTACNRHHNKFDASGTFEADEVIVSASANGKILGPGYRRRIENCKGQRGGPCRSDRY